FRNEYFTVAYLARRSCFYDSVNHLVDKVIRQDEFEFDFGQKIHAIFPATINFGVALLPPMTAHIEYRHALHAELSQGFLYRFKSGRLNNRFKFCHLSILQYQSFIRPCWPSLPTSEARHQPNYLD